MMNKYPLTIVGNGKQTRDFIYISDVINGLIKLQKQRGQYIQLRAVKDSGKLYCQLN